MSHHVFTVVLSVFLFTLSLPISVFAQSHEGCVLPGDGGYPDHIWINQGISELSYTIDEVSVDTYKEITSGLFSLNHMHMMSWTDGWNQEHIAQLYKGEPYNATHIGSFSLGNTPPSRLAVESISGPGQYFFVVFWLTMPPPVVSMAPTGVMTSLSTDSGGMYAYEEEPDWPSDWAVEHKGPDWYRRYFETGVIAYCGSDDERTSVPPNMLPWDIISFKVSGSETTPPTLSYATSTVYGDDGIHPDKGVADEDELTFAVVYTDAENDAPEYVRAWIRDDEGTDTFLDMILASQTEAGADAPATLTDGNYQNGELFTATSTFPKGAYKYTFLAAESDGQGGFGEEQSFPAPQPEDSDLVFQTGYSSVAFLPGVMASRLYVEGDRVWEPSHDGEARQLFLDIHGDSTEDDVYVEEGEVIDEEAGVAGNIYKTWLNDLQEWRNDGFIADYVPLAYDWRLSFDDILSSGIHIDDRIYYGASHITDTPYIYEELKRLADESDSGKVTIVAHSMGGLLLKKALYDLEQNPNHPYRFLLEDKRIEDVVLVASPQWGTAEAVPALLHGERLDKSALGYNFMRRDTGRELAWTMPSAHVLVPSEAYMEHVTDVDGEGNATGVTKVVRFNQSLEDVYDPYIVYDTILDFFGNAITTYDNLLAFLGGDEGRPMPEMDDVVHPIKLFNSMTSYGETLHSEIDDWSAPDMDTDGNPDIRVVQIAGWGIPDTIKGYEYYTKYTPIVNCQTMGAACVAEDYKKMFAYKPIFTYEGDKTVVLPSAVAMDTETYYVNLDEHNEYLKRNREHASILEPPSVRVAIHNIIEGVSNVTSGLPYIATNTDGFELNKNGTYIRLAMHSPVNVHVYDSEGNHVGVTEEGNIDELIPNSYYTTFGESAYLGIPGGEEYTIVLEGTDTGTFTFEMTEEENGTTTETVFTDVFVEEGAVAEMAMQHVSDITQLTFDTDNDGEADAIVLDDATEETTTYDTLRKRIEESTLSKAQKRLFRKKIDTIEKLHVRGNVIAARTLLIVLQKRIERLDCENARGGWKKKICISSEDILPINTVIIVLLEKLENPVNERKEDIKNSGRKLRNKLKDLFNR